MEGTSSLFAGGGMMGARMQALDWASTPLGPLEAWPSSLRAIVRVMLTSRFAMWMAWGPELTFLCNDAYLPTTGLKSDWVLGARSDRVWAEIWPDIGPRIEQVLRTGTATWDEALPLYLARRGFSEETYHTFSYSPLTDDDGVTAGMLCVVAEVTERVIGERQLATLRDLGSRLAAAATREQAMSALEASLRSEPRDLPFALAYLLDPAGHVRLAALHGLEPGVPAAPMGLTLDEPGAAWPFGRVLQGGTETVSVGPDMLGNIALDHWQSMPHQALVVPIIGAEGGLPVGFLVAGLNPHRALDAAYRGFLELIAGQLAAAIARADEYERARARAEALAEIDRAKTVFFSNVSHEFRTPLTLMLGPLEDALADPALPPEQGERIAIAHRNGLRLLRLVNGLLDFSRIESGRIDASFQPIDLAAYTAELASTFRSACERAQLDFQVDCPPLSKPVYVDPQMWEKVVLNLLSNAFKFTLEGGIAVSLRAVDDAAELTVADTGTGIPAAELPRLFERFHRVEGARGRSFEGSGIGLALVHDLVRLHGGSVSVESEEDRGSTFRVRIPFGTGHLAPERIKPPSAALSAARALGFVDEALRWLPSDQPPASLDEIIRDTESDDYAPAAPAVPNQAGHVLLADDNADLRDYVRRLLERRGYTVDVFGDGEAALAACRANRPDLLLTDVMMPKMSGFALLAAIRADPALADLPVVMLSARAGEEAQVEGLEAGADDYLAKPFSARELLARVATNLETARTRREATAAIRTSEARLRGVLDGMAEGFALLDRDFRIVEINPEGLRIDPRPRESIIGRTHWEAYPGSEESEIGQLFKQAMATRAPVSLEHRWVWPDGRETWFDMRAYATEDGGLAIFYRDVTDRRQAQNALIELNETLERRIREAIAEREAALARLHEAQKLEMLGQLTGGVAHDFNNLLTPIMSGLQLLSRWHDDERSQRLISAGLQSGERARVLVQRLLAFARRQDLAPQPIDPATLIDGMRDLIARSLGPNIRIEFDTAEHLPPALVDPNQLELALLNLAVNARDAMEAQGGGTLSIVLRADTVRPAGGHPVGLAPGDYVLFEISDTGAGMDEATLARAVEPFFSTKEIGKGTGLGLSMVHGLALQSGGALRLVSAPGAGTTATLWLPVALDPPAPAPAKAIPASPAARRATLLLVDDEPLVRISTAGLLQELGYEVVSAGAASEALDLVRNGLVPELVVTDHLMPGMTGIQLAAELRARVPDLRVLMVSGYFNLSEEEADGLQVLGKPFAFGELAARIADLIDPGEDGSRS